MAFFVPDFIQFFKDLAPNNNKDWFDENRNRYAEIIREPFKAFVDHMIVELTKVNLKFKDLQNKDCIFRINRDIRFSKDKTPYKMNVSALIAPGGKKNYMGEGIYFELGPEHVRIYSGLYELDKDTLLLLREGIAKNQKEFKKLYSDKNFESTFGQIRGEQNKIIPKELREAAESENLIFNKQFYYFAQFPPKKLLAKDFDKTIIEIYNTARPMEQFFSTLLKQ
ncbi:DUF2461 domain-containing protein [Crocinitomicaceae bacterium]|nr:DUF2461 domain-containing protein [Crocinitomicaceae bacterium]